ncbi:MAG: hypothetical protein KBT04_02810 [Bacteroidales bacterium]|nr:hypothetical protein [Candidatus Colimorpha onthohippi]
MKSSNIYTTIYEQQGIVRKVKPIWWAVYGTIIGLVCAYFFFYSTNLSNGLSAVLLGMLVVGVFSLLTLLCYHTFGDRHFPYHQPTRQLLEPTAVYYPSLEKENIIGVLENKQWDDLQKVKKINNPAVDTGAVQQCR